MQLYHVHFIALLISYQQYLLKWVEGSCPVKEVHDPERRFAVFERRIIGMIKPSSQCSTAGDSSFASVTRSTIFFFFVGGGMKNYKMKNKLNDLRVNQQHVRAAYRRVSCIGKV